MIAKRFSEILPSIYLTAQFYKPAELNTLYQFIVIFLLLYCLSSLVAKCQEI